MFKCCRCKELKIREEFGGIKKRSDYCKLCAYKINREYSAKTKLRRNEVNRACAARRYVINRRNLIEYLNQHPCIDCGETDIVVLEFDHREPSTKRAKIANILGSWNWETVMIEIDKCDVRCANDHRRRTSEQFGWFKGLAEESDVMPDDKDEGLD